MFEGARRPPGIFGVTMDLGHGRRGVDMGPSAIRYARLQGAVQELGYGVADLGNAEAPIPEAVDKAQGATEALDRDATAPLKDGEVRQLKAVRNVCTRVAERAEAMISKGYFPIFLGGNHSISIGTVSGVAKNFERTGVIGLDAHADSNTPQTSPSENIYGMPLSVLTGRGHPDLVSIGGEGASVRTEDVVVLGLRSLDLEERHLL